MTAAPHFSYEELHYVGRSYYQTHPHQMAVQGRFYGMQPAPIEHCRVLELACGDGANLVPMAYALPESTFLGVDLAAGPLKLGRERAAALGLKNLRLEAGDLTRFPAEEGQFDYIIAHGIYSWCPPEVREELLAVCARHLAPQGIAFVSFNALPGYHIDQQHREMMLYHLAQSKYASMEEQTKEALGLLAFLANSQPEENLYQRELADGRGNFELTINRLGPQAGQAWFHHDLLSDHNHPVYFHQFAGHADLHGLQFISDATLRLPRMVKLPPPALAALERLHGDTIRQEQYLDFIMGIQYRQVLVTHKGVPIDRRTGPDTLRGLYFAGEFRLQDPPADNKAQDAGAATTYVAPKGKVAVNHPAAKAILQRLGEAWPLAVPCAELLGDGTDGAGSVAESADFLLQMASQKLATFRLRASVAAISLSEQPEASLVARLQAETGPRVTNLHHMMVSLGPALRLLVRLLDGQRGRAELLQFMSDWIVSGQVTKDYERARAEDLDPSAEDEWRPPTLDTLENDLDVSLRALLDYGLLVR